jgi:membrane-associated phospholipid phosphatase
MIWITSRTLLLSAASLLLACALLKGHAQESVTLPDEPGLAAPLSVPERMVLPDSPAQSAVSGDPGQTMRPSFETATGTPQREATWRSLPGDFLHDQKDIWWTFPKQLAKGRHWVPTLVIVGGTAGLIYADPHVMPYFRAHQTDWDDFNDVFDPMITTGEVIALPASFMAAGYVRHDDREVSTALLAAEAYGDSVVVNLAIKAVTRRERPSDVPPGAPFTGTFFNGGKSPFKGSSFPSGHATAVWSVATVVAERYRHRGKPWVPVLCYTMASVISFSRITEEAHFPSDVWLGASLGYTIARYQTLRPRETQ